MVQTEGLPQAVRLRSMLKPVLHRKTQDEAAGHTSRRVLRVEQEGRRMTANEALERRIDELCEENERLRQQVASIIGRSFRTADKMDCLATENAKLRELVAQRTAKRVIVSNSDTDHATGHCECGACGGAIDPWDAWCRHCGAKLEEDE